MVEALPQGGLDPMLDLPWDSVEMDKSVKRVRCGACRGCLGEDCGQCANCMDKPKFGGAGASRKR